MIRKIATVIIAIAALTLIGYGCYRAYPPAGFIVPGLLLWFDITRMAKGVNNVDSGHRSG